MSERGRRRRAELLDATLRIVVREGPAAVSHRTVAEEAGASHGLVTYHFGTRAQLVLETLRLVAERNILALEAARPDLDAAATDIDSYADRLAEHVTTTMIDDRANGVAILELHLAAAREPDLRDGLREWGRAYARIAGDALRSLGSRDPEGDIRLLVDAVNGVLLQQLALPRDDVRERSLRPMLRRLLADLGTDPATSTGGPGRGRYDSER